MSYLQPFIVFFFSCFVPQHLFHVFTIIFSTNIDTFITFNFIEPTSLAFIYTLDNKQGLSTIQIKTFCSLTHLSINFANFQVVNFNKYICCC